MKFIATGRVHPERADVHFKEVKWELGESKISVSCVSSQLFAVIDDPRVSDYLSAHGTAEHVAQIFLSSLGFLLGCGYKAEITQVIDADQNSIVVGVQEELVRFDVGGETFGTMFLEVLQLARNDLFLRFAIQDYTNAITDNLGCAMLCYRSIESLAKSISGGGTSNTDWAPMHKALGTNKDMIENTITTFAKPIRHGNWSELTPMTSEQRVNVLQLTRSIISHYIDFSQGSVGSTKGSD